MRTYIISFSRLLTPRARTARCLWIMEIEAKINYFVGSGMQLTEQAFFIDRRFSLFSIRV
jgi:hypothetical protein